MKLTMLFFLLRWTVRPRSRLFSEWSLPESWTRVLQDELETERHLKLREFVAQERAEFNVGPAPEHTLRALREVSPEDTRVVILGQDPYPRIEWATGLAFASSGRPPSLRNIETEFLDDVKSPPNLMTWPSKGVLLLNTVLTVREGEPLSHANQGWEEFTDAVIRAVPDAVFVLWGSHARKKDVKYRVESAHPSPLSARRGFFGSKPFSQVNEILKRRGEDPIDWTDIRFDLNCPFSDKDQVKLLGARWDPQRKTWYVTCSASDVDRVKAVFAKWGPLTGVEAKI